MIEREYNFSSMRQPATTQAWNTWFTQNSIDPLRITYEALDNDPEAIVRSVLDFIGVASARITTDAPTIRMADATSLAWAERFKAETGYVG